MNTRKVPIRNYIILVIVAVLTIVLLYAFVTYYESQKEYQSRTNARMGFLSQVKESELSNYILDNPDTIIYVSNSTDSKYESFEQELKKLIISENLIKDVVYMDTYQVSKDFFKNLKTEMFVNVNLASDFIYPNIYIVRDGIITSILYTKEQEPDPNEVINYVKGELNLE